MADKKVIKQPLKGKRVPGPKPLKGVHIGQYPTERQKEWYGILRRSNKDFGLVSIPHNKQGLPYKTMARAEHYNKLKEVNNAL
jgi:hypothetical protein